MVPETCWPDIKRLINEKVVASCWLFTSFYITTGFMNLPKNLCAISKHYALAKYKTERTIQRENLSIQLFLIVPSTWGVHIHYSGYKYYTCL